MSIKSFFNNLFGESKEKNETVEKEEAVKEAKINQRPRASEEIIIAPMDGKVYNLKDIKDPAFSSGAIGKGLAIQPSDGKVLAPCDGTISMIFETGHAVGITSDNGVEILIHIGMDTVELKGEGFKPYVQKGDRVTVGQLLIDVDLDALKKAGYETMTPVVVTNHEDLKNINQTDAQEVSVGDELLTVII